MSVLFGFDNDGGLTSEAHPWFSVRTNMGLLHAWNVDDCPTLYPTPTWSALGTPQCFRSGIGPSTFQHDCLDVSGLLHCFPLWHNLPEERRKYEAMDLPFAGLLPK